MTVNPSRPTRVIGQFSSAAELKQAARDLKDQGQSVTDAHTPFPIHGLDDILDVPPTRLPWLVLGAGLSGAAIALAFQWWTNTVDYPFLVSGKPLFSLPANIPVTFEVTILAAALTAFFGMLALNRLPRLANPIFASDLFRTATDDRFFLVVETTEVDSAREQLQAVGAAASEVIPAEEPPPKVSPKVWFAAATMGVLAFIPPLLIASARETTSEKPRFHNFFDMDVQPKRKAQTVSRLFEDGRAMRPRVAGTIARGQLKVDRRRHFGREPAGDATQDGKDNWVEEFPLPVTDELMQRGREQFNIHCAVCHGRGGKGNGLVSQRALALDQGTWVPPTSLHADYVRQQPIGQLFHSITNGIRKMPAYGHQIPVDDRWAIVLYIRALQRSQAATIDDVPAEMRPSLRELN